MKLILSYLKRHIVIFLISTAFLTLEAVADLMQPTYMSYIVDEGVANADVSRILGYGGIMLGIALFGALCAVMRNHFASRDGYGLNDKTEGNAVAQAKTPVMDRLMKEYPFVKGNASGMFVGLPDGQMGNSEVGHLNMGAGRIVYQDLTRITKEIQDG